jgi:hypothetical protein
VPPHVSSIGICFFSPTDSLSRKWQANKSVTILTSPLGDKFILHATPNLASATLGRISGAPIYPPGWWIRTQLLDEDLVLSPEMDDLSASALPNGRVPFGQYSCGYIIVTDSAGNSFHRYHNVSGLPESFRTDVFGEILLFGVFHQSISLFALLVIVLIILVALFTLLTKISTSRAKSSKSD